MVQASPDGSGAPATTPPSESRSQAGVLDLHEGIATPTSPALDLHEGLSDPRTGCRRWPEHLRLLNETTGEVVVGRCKATNRCEYCARLMAVETSELLLLDALEDAPSLYVVLTARELLERSDCRQHLVKLRRSLKRRWPAIRWAVLVEFQRRGALHLNLLVKGVPVEDRDELHERACGLWCSRVDAESQAQFVGEVTEGGGLVRYIALHFLKPEQAPPIGWRGHRWSYTRDYLVRPAADMRQEARASLALKRELWRAHREGHNGQDAEMVAADRLAVAAACDWRLFQVNLKRGSSPRPDRASATERWRVFSRSEGLRAPPETSG